MKKFRALLLIFAITMPYLVLAILIPVTLGSTGTLYWVCLILLFIGLLSFFVDVMLPIERNKK